MNITKSLFPALIVAQFAFPALAQSTDALNAEITVINQQITEVDSVIEQYDGGLIEGLAKMRREALQLSLTVLQNRLLVAKGSEPTEIVIPVTQPDEAQATKILGDMVDAQRRIEEAELEATQAGGLIKALALSRVETEKLTLAQLQMAYFQAKYGIAFPAVSNVQSTSAPPNTSPATEPSADVINVTDALPWADPRFPQVDYSLAPFEQAHRDGENISGWWTIETERAAVDDSPQITAINYSSYQPNSYSGITALLARCTEGETALIFLQDDYLITDYRRNTFDITYRLDDAPAQQTRWSSLTSSKGAGLFGQEAERFIRQIYDTEQMFIRLVEKNGQKHDATFDLSGGQDAYEDISAACGWTTLTLSANDYQAIQTLLNAGGFDAGTPDGQWGPGSKRAMKAFQASVGLPETGAPDRDTLIKLGVDQ